MSDTQSKMIRYAESEKTTRKKIQSDSELRDDRISR